MVGRGGGLTEFFDVLEESPPVEISHHDDQVGEREPEASHEFIGDPEVETEVVGHDQIKRACDKKTLGSIRILI